MHDWGWLAMGYLWGSFHRNLPHRKEEAKEFVWTTCNTVRHEFIKELITCYCNTALSWCLMTLNISIIMLNCHHSVTEPQVKVNDGEKNVESGRWTIRNVPAVTEAYLGSMNIITETELILILCIDLSNIMLPVVCLLFQLSVFVFDISLRFLFLASVSNCQTEMYYSCS